MRQIEIRSECPRCRGDGITGPTELMEMPVCTVCDGNGYLSEQLPISPRSLFRRYREPVESWIVLLGYAAIVLTGIAMVVGVAIVIIDEL